VASASASPSPSPSARRKVRLLTAAWPGRREPHRGLFVSRLAASLAARGFDLDVVAPRISPGDERREGAPPIVVRRFFTGDTPGRRLKQHAGRPPLRVLATYAAGALSAALAGGPADLVYAHWVLPMGVVGALAAARLGAPLAIHLHGSDVRRYARPGGPLGLAARLALRRAAAVLAVSEDLAAFAREAGVPDERLRVVPLGVDVRLFRPPPDDASRAAARRALAIENGTRIAVFVGDLTADKGPADLAAAIDRLGDGFRAVFAGDGPLRPALAARPRSLVLGAVPNEGVPALLAAADVFCLPSRSEGAPVSVMEALACGVPVVATPVGAVPDLLAPAGRGRLVAPGDVPALADALAACAAGPRPAPARELDIERRADDVVQALETALAPGRGGRRA